MTQDADSPQQLATVTVTGVLRDGVAAVDAVAALQTDLGLGEAQAGALCSGRPRKVKSGLPLAQARALAVRLHRCGVLARVEVANPPESDAAGTPTQQADAPSDSVSAVQREAIQPEAVQPAAEDLSVLDQVAAGRVAGLTTAATSSAAEPRPATSLRRWPWLLGAAVISVVAAGLLLWRSADSPASTTADEPARDVAAQASVAKGWSLQSGAAGDEALCVLHSPVLDESGNTFIVSSADGGKLWVPALFFSRPSPVLSPDGAGVTFSVDGRAIARSRLQRTQQGPAFANFNADPMAGYALLYAMAEGLRLTIDGSALRAPVHLSLADFRQSALGFQRCLDEGDFFDYRLNQELAQRNAAWAFSMEQFVTSLVMLETAAPTAP